MAEPAFYRCATCRHAWRRMEWKIHANPPPECPRCGSTAQHLDQTREDEYVRGTYGQLASIVVDAIKKKL